MAIKPMVFATQGVENFMEGAMKIDVQDFVSKLEGFAVQGVVGMRVQLRYSCPILNTYLGAAKNHQQRVSAIRANIRSEILNGLSTL
jgi:hypothetical protein